jgi:hypothetical protein
MAISGKRGPVPRRLGLAMEYAKDGIRVNGAGGKYLAWHLARSGRRTAVV